MKKKALIISLICFVIIAAVFVCVFVIFPDKRETSKINADTPDEGSLTVTDSSVWIDPKDNTEHTVLTYTLGNTASRVASELPDGFVINHKSIDDVFLYEIYREDIKNAPMLFFLHGQSSRKEENLEEMTAYAEEGYFCVALDLQGHGERISDEPIMALDITKNTAADIDLLLNYYDAAKIADTDRFALNGFSQGGSVAYWYAVYGDRTPGALVVGCTSPDYTYSYDDNCICNGEVVDSIWSEDEIAVFVEKYNPIQHADKLMNLPIMSGNSLDDTIVSYKGSESLEKILKQGGNQDIQFYYFDGAGHNVTTEFVEKILPFIKRYL